MSMTETPGGPASPGFTIWVTGLPASGKSTLASALRDRLERLIERPVTILDGDIVRQSLSVALGYSRADRDTLVRKVAERAAEVTKAGGIALCAVIAPYDITRREARAVVEAEGPFVLVYVSTPLEACEARDPKGLYAKARAGIIGQFTGVSDPYEPPLDAALEIDTTRTAPHEAVDLVLVHLRAMGLC
jgi:sulfate adenylyltransferase